MGSSDPTCTSARKRSTRSLRPGRPPWRLACQLVYPLPWPTRRATDCGRGRSRRMRPCRRRTRWRKRRSRVPSMSAQTLTPQVASRQRLYTATAPCSRQRTSAPFGLPPWKTLPSWRASGLLSLRYPQGSWLRGALRSGIATHPLPYTRRVCTVSTRPRATARLPAARRASGHSWAGC